MIRTISSSDPALNFARLYLPSISQGPAGVDVATARGSWLFLQFDLIIIALSSLSWAYFLTSGLIANNKSSHVALLMVFALGGVVIGPGATVSLALFWRESVLEQQQRLIAAQRLMSLKN